MGNHNDEEVIKATMSELTVEEMEVLIDAVDEWKGALSRDLFAKDLVRIIMSTPEKKPEDPEAIQSRYKEAAISRDEQATLLKAKLIMMRNGLINKTVQTLLKEAN